jgi:hypothetical protein
MASRAMPSAMEASPMQTWAISRPDFDRPGKRASISGLAAMTLLARARPRAGPICEAVGEMSDA